MIDGDFFVGAALSTTLTKLALRYISLVSDPKRQNMVLAEAMLIEASIIHFGKSGLSTKVSCGNVATPNQYLYIGWYIFILALKTKRI